MYFSQESIGPLTEVLLNGIIIVVLLLSHEKFKRTWQTIGFFAALEVFLIAVLLSTTLDMPWRLLTIPVGLEVFLVGLTGLVQVVYDYPRPFNPREARWAGLGSALAILIGGVFTTLHLMAVSVSDFAGAARHINVVVWLCFAQFIWIGVMLFRQARRSARAPDPITRSAQFGLPTNIPSASRAFAFVLAFPLAIMVLALWFAEQPYYLLLFNAAMLGCLFSFVVVYFDQVTTSRAVSFLVKLLVGSFTATLVVMGVVGEIMLPLHLYAYDMQLRPALEQVRRSMISGNPVIATTLSPEILYIAEVDRTGTVETYPVKFATYPTLTSTRLATARRESRSGFGATSFDFVRRVTRTALGFWEADQYLSYQIESAGKIYEVGFAWQPYRDHVQAGAVRLVYLILGSLLLVALAFTAFFRNNVAGPLNALVEGMRQVNAGRRDVSVPVKNYDEIGFLTESFNNMVTSLRRMDELKDQFLASTSHELRSPLHGIIGLTDSLLENSGQHLTPTQHEHLNLILLSSRRLARLVNDILDFSQLRARELRLQCAPLDLFAVTEVVLAQLHPLTARKKLRLLNHLPADLPLVYADEDRVQQILHNLLGNAIKFTDSGRVEVTAELIPPTARQTQSYLQVTVADTGIGIPPDKLEVIFEMFQQADDSIARQYGGTGLGLALTRQLVQLHGGVLRVESALQHGSRFIFTLPIVSPDLVSVRAPALPLRETITEHAPPLPADIGAEFKLLIVDDDPVNVQVLVGYLARYNFNLIVATDGAEALDKVEREGPFHLILLDVMMPKLSGLEVTYRLREKYPAPELPILLLTARHQTEDLVEGFEVGANDYLVKPIAREELLARVRTQLKLVKLTSTNEALQQANQLKTDLISVAAHDLKNPLVSVSGYAELIQQPVDDLATIQQFATHIQTAAERMLVIINQLLESAALESAQLKLDQHPINAADLLNTIETRRRPQAQKKQQQLKFDFDPHIIVRADEPRLLETFDNLVDNAIKYSPLGKNIQVSLSQQDGWACFRVQDEGLGLSEADKQKIFGKFQRLSARPTANEGSAGLGLYIVKRIVELHGGRVMADSPGQGQGSTFTVLLPLAGVKSTYA